MTLVGIAIGCVGMDIYTGERRFTFALLELDDGLSLVSVAMGFFGVTEVMTSVTRKYGGAI